MFNPFKQLGDLKQMRNQAIVIQKQLAEERVEVDKNGVHIVMSGDQKVLEFTVDGSADNRLIDTINEAIKKSQEVAAKKLQEMSGGLGGMLGQ